MSELTREIRSAGFWFVVIHPIPFVPDRVKPITELFPLISRLAVEIRGWDYPHVDRDPEPTPGVDSVGQELSWDNHAESWKFYQSGQFVALTAFTYDRRDKSDLWPSDASWRRGALLGIGDALYRFVEIFELAARLSKSVAGDETMHISITVGGLQGRVLAVDSRNRWPLRHAPPATIPEFTLADDFGRLELAADSLTPAIAWAQELFRRFGKEISADDLRDWLKELRRF